MSRFERHRPSESERRFAASQRDRRRFLITSGALALGAAPLARLGRAAGEEPKATASEPASGQGITLRADPEQSLMRVRIEMKVQGNVDVPENPLVSRKRHARFPLNSNASFDYVERYRRPAGAAEDSIVTAAERYYHEATSRVELNENKREIELRDAVRQTVVRRDMLPEVIYVADDYFTHEELDLLRLPAASVAVDRLLPEQPVRTGATYRPSRDVLCSVLNLTSVDASEVEAEVAEITDSAAKIKFRGALDGSVEGVPTRMRLVGKLSFNRHRRVSTWLAMAIHETREIGKAEPGFDVSATVKLRREPLAEPVGLPEQPPPLAITEPIPPDRLYVELRSDELGVSVLMNRNWRMMRDVPGSAMMRMIENDRSIAQCDFRSLPKLPDGKQWTLEAFQQDVQRSLGDRLEQLIEADQRVSDSGLRVLRITAGGQVEGVPVRWIMLHFSDDSGRRLSATFTMDGQSAEAFAGSDVQLANSLQLIAAPRPADRGDIAEQSADDPSAGEPAETNAQAAADVTSPSREVR